MKLPDGVLFTLESDRKGISVILKQRDFGMCRSCKWWTQQQNSIQGRCELLKIYPTGSWYCANWKEEGADSDERR